MEVKPNLTLAIVPQFRDVTLDPDRDGGWEKHLGPRWQENMEAELEDLRETMRFVVGRGARVVAVVLPTPSW